MPHAMSLQHLCGLLDRGDIDQSQFLDLLCRRMVKDIGCSRAGVRMLIDTPGGAVLRTLAMFDAKRAELVRVRDMFVPHRGVYFDLLEHRGAIVAPDCLNDPVTADFVHDYLRPQHVHSLLEVAFSVNGVLYGTFSCEQVGEPQSWSPSQLQRLRQIASRVSLALMHAITSHIDTAPGALWQPSTPNRLLTLPMPLDDDDLSPQPDHDRH